MTFLLLLSLNFLPEDLYQTKLRLKRLFFDLAANQELLESKNVLLLKGKLSTCTFKTCFSFFSISMTSTPEPPE